MPIPVKILWDKLPRNCLTLPNFKMREPPLRLKGGGGSSSVRHHGVQSPRVRFGEQRRVGFAHHPDTNT